jgi:glycosyltransferase involved in cell wall biosynthesis
MANTDAVIARLPSENALLAAKLARRLGKPMVMEAAACAWDQLWNYGSLQGKLYAPVQMWRMRQAIKKGTSTTYVSKFLQQRYPSQGMSAVISDVDLPTPPRTVLERRLEHIRRPPPHLAPRQRLVFGLIGSIQHKYKGVQTALEALTQVLLWLPDFELRVLGPGDPRPWQELANKYGLKGRVRFCGVLPSGPPVLAWLDEVDLYLQPSFQEGLPRALVEAMSRGCPALGSTAGGIPELLSAECLHRPGDAKRLGRLIVHGATDTGWLEAQAQRNFLLAKEYARDRLDDKRADFWHAAIPWRRSTAPAAKTPVAA